MADNINVLISQEDVEKRIKELGAQISEDYEGKELTVICILKGSLYYASELTKNISVPVFMEFMRCQSYGSGTVSSGDVKVTVDTCSDIKGKHVLVVEDIIDSGNTLSRLVKLLKEREPASLALTTLLDKPERRETAVDVDYIGFTIPDAFVVGYGLDYDEKYRNLPYIGVVEA